MRGLGIAIALLLSLLGGLVGYVVSKAPRDFPEPAAKPVIIARPSDPYARATPAPSGKPDVELTFDHVRPVNALLEVKQYGEVWTVRLWGGADQRDGADVPADCELRGEGHLEKGAIIATLVPFKGEGMSVETERLNSSPGGLAVTIRGSKAQVSWRGGGILCPANTVFDGAYERVAKSRWAQDGQARLGGLQYYQSSPENAAALLKRGKREEAKALAGSRGD